MHKKHLYERLNTDTARERYVRTRLKHLDSQVPSEEILSLMVDRPVGFDTRNIPLLTWEHVLNLMQDSYGKSAGYPLNIVVLKQPHMEIPEHTHDYFELIYVLSGNSIHSINGNKETLHEGDFCILPPPARHAQYSAPGNLTIKLMIRPEIFTGPCAGLLKKQETLGSFLLESIYGEMDDCYLLFPTDKDERILNLILEMYQEMLHIDNYTDLAVTGMLLTLLSILSRGWPGAVKSAPIRHTDHQILSFIHENYATITLDALASHLHYTVPYCSKYIKKLFGCTFSQLLHQIRFQQAEILLQDSILTVAQISDRLGYRNPENFMRAFKKQYHMTPSQYRSSCAQKKQQ